MASVSLDPYLNFRDNTREAMEFYHQVFGGKLDMNTFKEFGASQDPSEDDLIMHSQLEADEITFMAADTPSHMEYAPGSNFSMSLSGEDEARLSGFFNKLADGGTVLAAREGAVGRHVRHVDRSVRLPVARERLAAARARVARR